MDKQTNIEQQERTLFGNLKIDYSRSSEDVWRSMEEMIREDPEDVPVRRIVLMSWARWSAAAVILLLIGSTLFAKLYTITDQQDAGDPVSHMLPDGSSVLLNEGTVISYAPYWWRFDRKVHLEGEAFFEVEKGRRFIVRSAEGSTEVMGTSFNIYARDAIYEVYCATGKVKVTDNSGSAVILQPGEFAGMTDEQPLEVRSEVSGESVLSWRIGSFLYNTTPLSKVLKDVERYYRIHLDVAIEGIDTLNYTGKFTRGGSPEEALEIICYSFGLDFKKTDDDRYLVKAH